MLANLEAVVVKIMKLEFRQTIVGSAFAFLLATSCCWLPWLAILLGSATGFAGISAELENFSGPSMVLGFSLLGLGIFQFYKKNEAKLNNKKVILLSTISCPKCGFQKEEKMPTDACQYFYKCENCQEILKPLEGDCCVFCSYGTVACPPIQMNEDCCN